jgi:hypothetical protein
MRYFFFLISGLAGFLFNVNAFAISVLECNTTNVSDAVCRPTRILIYEPGSITPVFKVPSSQLSIEQLKITYSVTLNASSETSFTYDATKWGIIVGTSQNDPTFSKGNTPSNDSDSKVVVDIDNSEIKCFNNYCAGTVVLTLNFSKNNYKLTSSFLSSSSLSLTPVYIENAKSNTKYLNSGLAFKWDFDTGVMLSAPSISVVAKDSAFVVNISPPTNFTAITKNEGSTNLTKASNPNSLSGYVLVYWRDSDANGNPTGCKANTGGWQFAMNPEIFNTAPTTPTTCTYSNYSLSQKTGGTSSALGCADTAISTSLPLDSTASTLTSALTADRAAIPYTPLYSNPSQLPSDSNGSPSGCYNVVYIPSSRSSWSKANINNGEIYGIAVWALNNGSTPKYSLAHSNISYITGVSLPLASEEKNPTLPKSQTDCFFVTAASGNPNSDAVFYWRIIRDEILTPLGITPYYYNYGPKMAQWLNNHPKLKPFFNVTLKYSGKLIYNTSKLFHDSKSKINLLLKSLQKILVSEAHAQDNNFYQQNLNKQPQYEFLLTGGVLFPSTDKQLFDKYFSNSLTKHLDVGGQYLFWYGNLGFSVGILGSYIFNSTDKSTNVLNSEQKYNQLFYSLQAKAVTGLRFRNPCWSYLQPGIYIAAGISRFREEATTGEDSSSTIGITNYSPILGFGGYLDLNLVPLFSLSTYEIGEFIKDISFRVSATYSINPSQALSVAGTSVQGGFVFLFN